MKIQNPIVQSNYIASQGSNTSENSANWFASGCFTNSQNNFSQYDKIDAQKGIISRDDFLINASTNNSQLWTPKSFTAYSDAILCQNLELTSFILNYWFCENIYSQKAISSYPVLKACWNEVWAELNKETSNWCCSTEELDASFLFPKHRKVSTAGSEDISHESSRGSLNDFSTEKNDKIFKVWRVPKVAFKMISRWDLARSHEKTEDLDEECEDDTPNDTFDKRKAAFGTKRDDLFYKTIGRDVRKYLQEQFQCGLGSKSLKEWLRNGTFLKEIKQFYKKEFNSKLSQDSSDDKLFCCISTLVSYQGFTPFLNNSNKEFSVKIHDSLHNFTKAKLINLCQLPEFKVVFKYYSSRVSGDNFNRFSYHRTMKSNVKGYKFAYCDILKQWD